MSRALLDTDILSEILKGKDARVARRAAAYLERHERFSISVITVMEVVRGFRRRGSEQKLERFLASLGDVDVLELSTDIATLGGYLDAELHANGQIIGTADVLIGATALHHNLMLVSGNIRHYARIQGLGRPLRLENWRD